MKKLPLLLVLLFGVCTVAQSIEDVKPSPSTTNTVSASPQNQEDEGIVMFTPPKGWSMVDTASLPKTVRVMVVGKGANPFPPSMNLSTEPYSNTLKDYLKIVKRMNESQGYEWKDLGPVQTEAGSANLSQVDTKTEWGTVRLMHVILVKNGRVYILTASALKDEFSRFYKEFFASLRSLRINKDVIDMVKTPQRQKQLKEAFETLQNQWKSQLAKNQAENNNPPNKKAIFESVEFQQNAWTPFKEMIQQKYSDMGPEWQSFVIQNAENDLFTKN